MNIGQICTREVVFAERSSSLQRAAALMREHHVGTVLVVDRGDEGMQVTGIVTDRDIVVEAVARGADVTPATTGSCTASWRSTTCSARWRTRWPSSRSWCTRRSSAKPRSATH